MNSFKQYAPVFWSKTFWGLLLGFLLKYASMHGWIDEMTMSLAGDFIFATVGVNIFWKGAKKVRGQ